MGIIKRKVTETVVKQAIKYIEKNPMENIDRIIGLANKIAILPSHKEAIGLATEMLEDKKGVPYKLVERLTNDLNTNSLKTFAVNFFVNAYLEGEIALLKNKEKYNCEIPWAILMEPTPACNLKCKKCFNSNNLNSNSLSYETISRVVKQEKELGGYVYAYLGGEPLIKKDEIIKIAENNKDALFLIATNGTLIDKGFIERVVNVGNIMFAINIDGFEKETNTRKGDGVYKKIINSIDILKQYKVGFGFITLYDDENIDCIISERFIDFMIKKGCLFGGFFNNGNSTSKNNITKVQKTIEKYSENKAILLASFNNEDEEKKPKFLADKSYIYIDCSGNINPSLFERKSNINIKNMDLVEALQFPIFK